MTLYSSTFVAYTGTSSDAPLVGGQDPVSQRQLEVLWASNSLGMAQQFQDGEIRKLRVSLGCPLVLDENERREQFGKLPHSRIVDEIHARVKSGKADWDGVVFLDTADGMEVADVIAIFPRLDSNDLHSVDHAVTVIGKTTFDEDLDEWVSTPGFTFSKTFLPVNPPWNDLSIAANGMEVCKNFDQWFADSKILNDLGRPLVVYHGTRPGNDIEAFDLHSSGQDGIYFTPDPMYAQAYTCALFNQDDTSAGPMYPVFLSIDRPYVVTTLDDSQAWEDFVYRALNRNELIEKGFNGAILRDAASGEIDQIIAFYPDQIKSAISNSGLYLKGNSSITDLDDALALKNANEAKKVIADMPSSDVRNPSIPRC